MVHNCPPLTELRFLVQSVQALMTVFVAAAAMHSRFIWEFWHVRDIWL